MRTLKSILLAGAMLLTIPAFFSSCQEDAPQIDYTMSVTVTNDFSKVVDAINNGTLKNEQAIAQLTAAIDKMNADQQTKLQAIKDVLNSVNATLDAKLAAIEAAMTAQTLSLEGKLALIEDAMTAQTLTLEKKCDALVAAIKGLPDYTAKLAAIETAIKALPNYEAQLKALNTLIEAQNSKLDDQIAALEGIMNAIPDYSNKLSAIENAIKAMPDYDAAINNIKDEIANLVKAVEDGNKSEADALAEITKKLEELKAAGGIGGGSEPMPIPKNCIDLGLPSGLLWAKSNMGTTEPTELGDYYAWGETSTKNDYKNSTYKLYKTDKDGVIKEILKYSEKDWKTVLEREDDAANANLGVGYRIPTQEDWQELLDNCKWEAVTVTLPIELDPSQTKSIARWIVTGPNGKYIILPATGGFKTWYNDSDKDTYYTTANLYLYPDGLADKYSYKRAVALKWPIFAEETSSGSIKKPWLGTISRTFGVVVRPVFDRYSNK